LKGDFFFVCIVTVLSEVTGLVVGILVVGEMMGLVVGILVRVSYRKIQINKYYINSTK
jgi:hypothetical protein